MSRGPSRRETTSCPDCFSYSRLQASKPIQKELVSANDSFHGNRFLSTILKAFYSLGVVIVPPHFCWWGFYSLTAAPQGLSLEWSSGDWGVTLSLSWYQPRWLCLECFTASQYLSRCTGVSTSSPQYLQSPPDVLSVDSVLLGILLLFLSCFCLAWAWPWISCGDSHPEVLWPVSDLEVSSSVQISVCILPFVVRR